MGWKQCPDQDEWSWEYLDWCSQSSCEERAVTLFLWHEHSPGVPNVDLYPCCEKCSKIYRGGSTFIEVTRDEVIVRRVMLI